MAIGDKELILEKRIGEELEKRIKKEIGVGSISITSSMLYAFATLTFGLFVYELAYDLYLVMQHPTLFNDAPGSGIGYLGLSTLFVFLGKYLSDYNRNKRHKELKDLILNYKKEE